MSGLPYRHALRERDERRGSPSRAERAASIRTTGSSLRSRSRSPVRDDGRLSPPSSFTRHNSVSESVRAASTFDNEPVMLTPAATPDIEAHGARRDREMEGSRNVMNRSGGSDETIQQQEKEEVDEDTQPDPRELIRIFQCQRCDRPIQDPIALPCGNDVCKSCIPTPQTRSNISYQATAGRLQGFLCPVEECGKSHAVGDCWKDVTLNKVLGLLERYVSDFQPSSNEAPLLLEEVPSHHHNTRSNPWRSKVLAGGKIIATYQMAKDGDLAYHSDLEYKPVRGEGIQADAIDTAVVNHLKNTSQTELDCQICYSMLLSPLTTPCGHTYCRPCVQRVLDHSPYCPICRSRLRMSASLTKAQYPDNAKIAKLLQILYPVSLQQREAQQHAEALSNLAGGDGLTTPLFVCTLAFPNAPTFLHVFEPRYRLMIRRALEADRRFGMVIAVPPGSPHGVAMEDSQAQRSPIYKYGTLLHIINFQPLPDGRSLIETIGVERFEVKRIGERDGYLVGETERLDDVSIDTEEAIEISEVTRPFTLPPPSFPAAGQWVTPQRWAELARLPTVELFNIVRSFVDRHRQAQANWLSQRIVVVNGEPPADMEAFTWWFASVVPLSEGVRAGLLECRSVRWRLRVQAGWVEGLNRVGLAAPRNSGE